MFNLENSLDFVFEKNIITQAGRKPKKSHTQKQVCAYPHKNNV